ncbi:pyruvate decarboxylase [Chryseobacterium sp.]|uniref:pyruvate decarboxylase n=1 Tax=Chryseobacterium sp. TaxID=1871047 RepID=UPI00289CF1C1|nr:pyruvate decarboxylase [Chryseobacterium sp.]
MKKELLLILLLIFGLNIQKISAQKHDEIQKILYFNPEVEPDVEEIKEPTNFAFFSAVSDNTSLNRRTKMIKTETQLSFETNDQQTISDYALNNDADFVTVSKVKYFKVGLGKYVFSNQVVVSMKLFDKTGKLITESSYDTYKKNMRLLGSAENSIKIGTAGALKTIQKNLRKLKTTAENGI